MPEILFWDIYMARPDVSEFWKSRTRYHLERHLLKGNIVAGVTPAGVVLATHRQDIADGYKEFLVDVWDRVYYRKPKKGITLDLPF